MKRKISRNILKYLIILGVPALLGVITFFIFRALESAYTSEAQIQVNEALWLDHLESGKNTDRPHQLNKKVQETINKMYEERPLEILSYHLLHHDLSRPPFQKNENLTGDFLVKWKKRLLDTLTVRIENLQPELGKSLEDSILRGLRMKWNYEIQDLANSLSVNQIPNTSVIRLQAQAKNAEMSGYLVNTFAEEFIRLTKEQEKMELLTKLNQVERSITHHSGMLLEKKTQLAEKKQSIEEAIDEELWNIQRRINRLVTTRDQEMGRIEELEKKLHERTKPSESSIPVISIADRTFPSLAQSNPEMELEKAVNRLTVIEKQLQLLEEKQEEVKRELVAPLEQEIQKCNSTLGELEQKKSRIEYSLSHLDDLLIMVVRSKTRAPSPHTSLLMALQAGAASFLLWIIFLFQAGYLKLFARSDKQNSDWTKSNVH